MKIIFRILIIVPFVILSLIFMIAMIIGLLVRTLNMRAPVDY